MNREEFLKTARVLSSNHGLEILGCLREKGWMIASDLAHQLEIHVTTASKDLSILFAGGILDRRMSKRKTRPAYEYKLRSERILLELSLDPPPERHYEEIGRLYVEFFDKLFSKAEKMGWSSIEGMAARELGEAGSRVSAIVAEEIRSIGKTESMSELREVFRLLNGKVRRVFEDSLGQGATQRLFDATAAESSRLFPSLTQRYDITSDF